MDGPALEVSDDIRGRKVDGNLGSRVLTAEEIDVKAIAEVVCTTARKCLKHGGAVSSAERYDLITGCIFTGQTEIGFGQRCPDAD